MAIRSNYANKEKVPPIRLIYRLPSAGIPYLKDFPGFPEELAIKPYSLETEGYLAGNSTVSDKMKFICSAVAEFPPGFEVGKLLVADEFAILAIARALTYGETYKFKAHCPNCSHVEIIAVNVHEKLPILAWDRVKPPKLEVHMPHSKDLVEVQMLTIDNDMATNKYVADLHAQMVRQGLSANEEGLGLSRRLAYQIAAVNGGTPDNIGEAEEYVRGLQGPDMASLVEHINKIQPGIRYEWQVVCDRCDYPYDLHIPILADFFRRNRVGQEDADSGVHGAAPKPPQDGVPAGPHVGLPDGGSGKGAAA